MESDKNINIEVVYASYNGSFLLTVTVPTGSTVLQGIKSSGILDKCPEIDLAQNKVGIFSKLRTLEETVNDGDRIEIYRPLIANPKEARRSRAGKQKNIS